MTVQRLQAGFGEKVEIVFKTGDMVSLASEVFNNTGLLFSNFRVISVVWPTSSSFCLAV